MFLFPYSTEVLLRRWPVANLVVIALCVVSFFVTMSDAVSVELFDALVLEGWNPLRLVTHLFLHAGFSHLFFNMVCLWIFGNAICGTAGNMQYLAVFFGGGAFAGLLHLVADGTPAIGASGAISAIAGYYLILYPVNRINIFYFIIFRAGTFDISGVWFMAFWFLGDLWHAVRGTQDGVAYWVHVGGFVAGAALGVFALKRGWAALAHYDNESLLDRIKGKTPEPIARRRRAPLRHAYRHTEPLVPVKEEAPAAKKFVETVNADCPHCGANIDIDVDMAGETVRCPLCKKDIQVAVE